MSQPVIITGMHRSGTSLVSCILQAAGLHVGQRLLAANSANPRGFFEDVDFYEFHESLLHQRGQSYLYLDDNFLFEPMEKEIERAQELVREREGCPVWGWKDPRTALFLEFWHEQLPEARFIFIYRHPLEVVLSLLRRGEFDNQPLVAAGLDAWLRYNASICEFHRRHSDVCLLVNIDAVVNRFPSFTDSLQEKLGLELQLEPPAFEHLYHVGELRKTPHLREAEGILAKCYPTVFELYHLLDAQADLAAEAPATGEPAVQAMSSLARFTAELSQPISEPIKQSVLQTLVSILSPEPVAKMLSTFQQTAQGAQQRIDHLWLQVQHLELVKTKQDATLREQEGELGLRQSLIEEQSGQLRSYESKLDEQREQLREQHAQLRNLREESKQQAIHIQALLAELARIYNTRAWKLIQGYWNLRERWQRKDP